MDACMSVLQRNLPLFICCDFNYLFSRCYHVTLHKQVQSRIKEHVGYVPSHWEASIHPQLPWEGSVLPKHHALPCPPCARLTCRAAGCKDGLVHKDRSQRHLSLSSLFWCLKKSTDKSSQIALLWTSRCLHLKLLLVIRCWEKKSTNEGSLKSVVI